MEANFPIVGIGASAGGLSALQELVQNIPKDSGFCYVIIQHLAPDHPSIMDQLLEPHTRLPVAKIKDGVAAEPNRIYLIPPGPMVTIDDGVFHLHERTDHGVRTPIDRFFHSLAEYAGRNAFCVVLSGTGSDGTLGLRDIKAKGGFAIVQEDQSARFPGMPNSAKATGMVDFVLRPSEIPAHLIDIQDHKQALRTDKQSHNLQRDIETNLDAILKLLRIEHGDDFSDYKTGTIVRRIERRMLLLRYQTVEGFVELLENNAEERSRLRQDFLIGVTHFFRDPQVWDDLRTMALLPLLASRENRIRIWVPGCSTGEEVYTLAILMHEIMSEANDKRSVQIFGTDIDQAALLHARKGIYTASSMLEVPEELVERYFSSVTDGCQISPTIREMCVFAPHNLIQDPPFSKLDLISCRNVLIYLSADVQKQIFPRFHYGLNPGGYLLLGPSETLGSEDHYFNILQQKSRIFKRDDTEALGYSSLQAGVEGRYKPRKRLPSRLPAYRPSSEITASENLEQVAEQFFLRKFARAFAVVDENMVVRYLSEAMAKFIHPTSGAPSPELDQFLKPEMRLPTRTVVGEARASKSPAVKSNVVMEVDGERRLFDVMGQIIDPDRDLVMVAINEVRMQDLSELLANDDARADADRDLLERELAVARQQLNSITTDYDSAEQELRSANEELLSMNEELQSSNEELETSREELQSINEELETINAELTENNKKLIEANSDLKNLFDSTDIATIFLDANKCLRRFTPAARRLFGVRERDIGRPISDLSSRLDNDRLAADMDQVADDLQPVEREVDIASTGETFILRVSPYRTTDDRIDGCVVTFFDISVRKKFELQLAENARLLAEQYAELETLYNQAPVGISLIDKDFRYLRINNRLAEINGFTPEEHIGKTQAEMVEEINEKIFEIQKRVLETGEPALGIEVVGTTPAEPDKERSWLTDYYPIYNGDEIFALGTCVVETTETMEMRRSLEGSQRLQSLALEAGSLSAFEINLRPETQLKSGSTDLIKDAAGAKFSMAHAFSKMVAADRKRFVETVEAARESDEAFKEIFELKTDEDEEPTFIEVSGQYFDDKIVPPRLIGLLRDVTTEVAMDKQQEVILRELQHRVKNTLSTILAIVRFSADSVDDVQALIDNLEDRLTALSKTHDILVDTSWTETELHKIIENELGIYSRDGSDQSWAVTGPDIPISPEQALALTLGIHELATNAAKYGALNGEAGRVLIKTELDRKSSTARLVWSEEDGPEIDLDKSRKSGFGTFMIEQVLASELDGSVERVFSTDGMVCTIEFPVVL